MTIHTPTSRSFPFATHLSGVLLLGVIACSGDEVTAGMDTAPPEETGDSGQGPTDLPAGPTELPAATEACPTFAAGDVEILGRTVHLYVDEGATAKQDGPLVFYWSAAGIPDPTLEVQAHFTPVVDEVVAAGGVVAAVYREACDDCQPSSGIPWWYVEDIDVADEVVACAMQTVGIDTSRIHVAGTSAGGIHTAQMLYRRSSYVASVATYSGGIPEDEAFTPTTQDASNRVPAIIMYGSMDFLSAASFGFEADLTDRGHFDVLCEHDRGHGIAAPLAPSVWAFFEAHPYKTTSPWAEGLPSDLYEGCAL